MGFVILQEIKGLILKTAGDGKIPQILFTLCGKISISGVQPQRGASRATTRFLLETEHGEGFPPRQAFLLEYEFYPKEGWRRNTISWLMAFPSRYQLDGRNLGLDPAGW